MTAAGLASSQQWRHCVAARLRSVKARGILGAALALVLAAGVLAGCGASEQSGRAGDDAQVEGQDRKGGFKGRRAKTFASTKHVCEIEPRSELAVAEGLSADSSIVAIARRYAAEWPRKLRRAAFQGCMSGLGEVPAPFPPSSPQAREIWERDFVVTSVTGEDDEPPVARPIRIRLSFSPERHHTFGWQARCNSFGGDVQFTATEMNVDQVGSTLVGCAQEVEEEDDWLADFMEADPEWRLDGERLQLISDSATIELAGFEDPNSCRISPSGGRVDFGNSGADCESALALVALHAEGKDRYLRGWKCRDRESASMLSRTVCRHGKKWFAVQGFDPAPVDSE